MPAYVKLSTPKDGTSGTGAGTRDFVRNAQNSRAKAPLRNHVASLHLCRATVEECSRGRWIGTMLGAAYIRPRLSEPRNASESHVPG